MLVNLSQLRGLFGRLKSNLTFTQIPAQMKFSVSQNNHQGSSSTSLPKNTREQALEIVIRSLGNRLPRLGQLCMLATYGSTDWTKLKQFSNRLTALNFEDTVTGHRYRAPPIGISGQKKTSVKFLTISHRNLSFLSHFSNYKSPLWKRALRSKKNISSEKCSSDHFPS